MRNVKIGLYILISIIALCVTGYAVWYWHSRQEKITNNEECSRLQKSSQGNGSLPCVYQIVPPTLLDKVTGNEPTLSINDLISSSTTTAPFNNISNLIPDLELGNPGTRIMLPPGDFFEVPTAGGVVFIEKNNKIHAEYIYKQEVIKDMVPFEKTYLVPGGIMYYSQSSDRVIKNYLTDIAIISDIADPVSFEFVAEDPFYIRDQEKVYFLRHDLNPLPILQQKSYNIMQTEADPKTFRIINEKSHLARDKSHVYMNGKILPDIDPNTLYQVMPETSYYKDKNAIYQFTTSFLDNTVRNFEGKVDKIALSDMKFNNVYTFDTDHVYYDGKLIQGADPNSFVILWRTVREGCRLGTYAKDNKAVYFEDKLVIGSDPNSFEPLLNDYGRDKQGVYRDGKIDPTLPKDFEPVCDYG